MKLSTARIPPACLISCLLSLTLFAPVVAQNPEQVEVLAKSTNANAFANSSSDNTVQFLVIYSTTIYDLNDFSISCTDGTGVSGCSASPTLVTLAPGDTAIVTVTFSTTSYVGTGTLQVTAQGMDPTYSDTGSDAFEIKESYAVKVTTLTPDVDVLSETYGHQAQFKVENTGFLSDAYTFTCNGAGPLLSNCTLDDSSEPIGAGASFTVTATFDASGTLTPSYEHIYLEATSSNVSDSSFHNVDVLGATVDVQPNSGSAPDKATGVQGVQMSFDVINTSSMANSYTFSCGGALITCTNVSPASASDVQPNDTVSVMTTFNVGATPGSGNVTLNADGYGGADDTGQINFNVVSSGDPVVVEKIADFGESIAAGTVDNVLQFRVTNNQAGTHTIAPDCVADWGLVTCDVQGGSLTLGQGQNATVTVHVDGLTTNPDSIEAKVSLIAEDVQTQETGTDSHEFWRFTYESTVLVLDAGTNQWPNQVGLNTTFTGYYTVENTGTAPDDFTLACSVAPAGTCEMSDTTLTGFGTGALDTITVTVTATQSENDQADVTLSSTATSSGHADQAVRTVSVPQVPALLIDPVQADFIVRPDTQVVVPFVLSYGLQTAEDFVLSVVCTDSIAGSCSITEDTITVTGGSDTVQITLNAGDDGDTGRIELTVTRLDSLVSATGAYDVYVRNTAWLTLNDANPGVEQVRGECLSIAAGAGAIECDDYRFVYPLTSVTRLNRARNIGLLYNSEQAHGKRTIGANITVPGGTQGLTSVKARLWIDGVVVDSLEYPDSVFTVGQPTRVAFDIDEGDHNGDALIPYQVDAQLWLGPDSVPTTSAEGYLLMVDRDDEFGEGWWVTGREQLEIVTDSVLGDVLVWTGGDGSSRLYLPDSAQVNTWVGQGRGVADTITASPPDSAGYLSVWGSYNQYAYRAPSYSGLTGKSKMTWAFWLQPTTNTHMAFAGIAPGNNSQSVWHFWIDSTGRIYARIYHPSNGSWSDERTTSPLPGYYSMQWNLITVEFDGTQSSFHDRMTIYVNGAEASAWWSGSPPNSLASGQPGTFYLGGGLPEETPLYGKLGEFAIIDGVLTAQEHSEWYAGGIDFEHPKLVAGYKWRGSFSDESPHGNHLTGNNSPGFGKTDLYPSRSSGSPYVRHLLGGGEVHYGATGRHTKTVDRNGNETIFNDTTIAGSLRLKSIELPTNTGTAVAYEFDYNGAAQLTSIEVAGESARTYTVWMDGSSRVDSLVAPDGMATAFGYEGTLNVVDSIGDARGVATVVSYEKGKVGVVSVIAGTIDSMRYVASSTKGLDTTGAHAAVPADSLTLIFDGPRSLTDITEFGVTGWGAIRSITNALGNQTILHRNTGYPSLVEAVEYPNGRIVTADYNSLGLITSTTDYSNNATTNYAWNEGVRRPTQITSPEGLVQKFGYDGAGNRLWQAVAGDTVTFQYGATGLLETVTTPLGLATTFTYDASGNVDSETSPEGALTRYQTNTVGQVTRVESFVDQADTLIVETRYDIMGRDTTTVRWSSLDDVRDSVATVYNAFGDRERVVRFSTSYEDTAGILGMESSAPTSVPTLHWTYDALGRVWKEFADDSLAVIYEYDRAGNVTKKTTKGGHEVRFTYDELGRVATRAFGSRDYAAETTMPGVVGGTSWTFPIYPNHAGTDLRVPGDSVTFVYDVMGNVKVAQNDAARVVRTYAANGLLLSETFEIHPLQVPTSATYDYTVGYVYDSDGRLTELQYPGHTPGTPKKATYDYHPTTGRLSSVVNMNGDTTAFGYDADSRLTGVTHPGGLAETRRFTDDGRLRYRSVGGFLTDSLVYDDLGRIIEAINATNDVTRNVYTGLGQLISSRYHRDGTPVVDSVTQRFMVDGLGHVLSEWTPRHKDTEPFEPVVTKSYTGGRLMQILAEGDTTIGLAAGSYPRQTELRYEADGSVRTVGSSQYTTNADGVQQPWASTTAERNYYDADGRLRFRQRHTKYNNPNLDERGAWEEFRYDPFGRRVGVLTRADSLCNVNTQCYSAERLYVWAGDQIAYEHSRTVNGYNQLTGQYGHVYYAHAGGIDSPVSTVKDGTTVVPHVNWRGQFASATGSSGTGCCSDAAWPGDWRKLYGDIDNADPDVATWYGSLLADQQDVSGLLYRRNRYYDPRTGQFTQEDPIGIAGGLNLYGYANGDPINFSDPYGLCPPEDTNLGDCPTSTEEERHLLRAYATLARKGGEGVLEAIVSMGVPITVTDAPSVVQTCKAQTSGCFDPGSNEITVALVADHAETATRIVHETIHAQFFNSGTALCYPRQEVLAWKHALDFYQGVGRNVPFYQGELNSRSQNPAAYYAGVRQRAGGGC